MPPIDLAESPAETAQMEQMRQEQPVTPEPVVTPEPKAAEPEPAKAAEPAPEPKPEAEKGDGHNVPLPVLLKERQARKAAEAALAELRKNPTPPEAPKPVDHNEDPLAAIGELRDWKAQREQQDRDREQMSRFQQVVVEREQEFVRDNPDYPKAIEFLKEARVRELRDGLGLNDQQIAQALSQEAAQTAAYAMQNDLNPADVFMRLAKVRGFGAAAPVPDPTPVPITPDPAAVQKMASLAKGLQAGKTVTNGGGGAALPAPSLEAIANLDGPAFDAAWKSGAVKNLMN